MLNRLAVNVVCFDATVAQPAKFASTIKKCHEHDERIIFHGLSDIILVRK